MLPLMEAMCLFLEETVPFLEQNLAAMLTCLGRVQKLMLAHRLGGLAAKEAQVPANPSVTAPLVLIGV